MTIYFQHVGEAGAQRDFPRTIGTPESGVVQFSFDDIDDQLGNLSDNEKNDIRAELSRYAPDGFQVWGIPSGAKSVIRNLQTGDYLLLLETVGPGGSFAYAGRVVGRPSEPCFDLSRHLWSEERFPLIVFLKGNLTNFSWYSFCDQLGYSRNWNPAGNTYRIQDERMVSSVWRDEDAVVHAVGGQPIPMVEDQATAVDFFFQDPAELDIEDEEGRRILREHLVTERSSKLIAAFKTKLSSFACTVCGFDFEHAYGGLGRHFIEAHHTTPLGESEGAQRVSIADLAPVCSNCHRMLHRKFPAISCDELREVLANEHIKRH